MIGLLSFPLNPRIGYSYPILSAFNPNRLLKSILNPRFKNTYLSALVLPNAEIEKERLLYISLVLKTKLSLGPLINLCKSSEYSNTFCLPRQET